MGGCVRGGKYSIELTLLKYLFLEELDDPPPAKPPAIVPTAPDWVGNPGFLASSGGGLDYGVILNLHKVDRSSDSNGILLDGPVHGFGFSLYCSISFCTGFASATDTTTRKAVTSSSTSSKSSRTVPRWWPSLDKAGQRPELDKFLYKVTNFGTLLCVVPDALVITAPKGRVCSWLWSSRSRKANEFQTTGFLQDHFSCSLERCVSIILARVDTLFGYLTFSPRTCD